MSVVGILIDLVTAVVFVVFVVNNYKKGFLYSVCETVGIFISSALAAVAASPVAKTIYNNLIAPTLIRKFNNCAASHSDYSEQISAVFDSLPQFVQNGLASMGISQDNLAYQISLTELDFAEAVESIVSPVFINFITIVCSVFLFFIFSLIVSSLVKMLTKSVDFLGLGLANRICGAAVGVVKSVFLFMIIALLTYVFISIMPTETANSVLEQIENTLIFRAFFDFNIPGAIISLISGTEGVALF